MFVERHREPYARFRQGETFAQKATDGNHGTLGIQRKETHRILGGRLRSVRERLRICRVGVACSELGVGQAVHWVPGPGSMWVRAAAGRPRLRGRGGHGAPLEREGAEATGLVIRA